MDINQILQSYNLGVLADVKNAHGYTNKGLLVWLPQINNNPYWKNVLISNDEIIVQLGLTGNPQQRQSANWNPAVVIIRDKQKNYHRLLSGKYRPVYYNKNYLTLNLPLAIHSLDTLSIAQGTVTTVGDVSWVTGFASSLQDAQTKADSYKTIAGI